MPRSLLNHVLLLIFVTSVTACRSDDIAQEDPPPSFDDPVEGVTAVYKLQQKLRCMNEWRCPEQALGWHHSIYGYTYMNRERYPPMRSEADCMANYTFTDIATLVSKYDYDKEAARVRHDELSRIEREVSSCHYIKAMDRALRFRMPEMLRATQEAGESCVFSAAQCKDGLECRTVDNGWSHCERECVAIGYTGDCDGCEYPNTCQRIHHSSGERTQECKQGEIVGLGENCRGSEELSKYCDAGLICDWDKSETCVTFDDVAPVKRMARGEFCNSYGHREGTCAPGLFCVLIEEREGSSLESSRVGICGDLRAEGQTCNDLGDCREDLFCEKDMNGSGTCIMPRAIGEPCSSDSSCRSLSCDYEQMKCVETWPRPACEWNLEE